MLGLHSGSGHRVGADNTSVVKGGKRERGKEGKREREKERKRE